MALATAEEGSQSVSRCRRIMELAAEEEEANSVVFPGVCCRMIILSASADLVSEVDVGRVALTCHFCLD